MAAALLPLSPAALGQADIEPNNECAQAQLVADPIALPFVINGSLDTPPESPDIDFFRFTAEAGVELMVDLKGLVAGVGTLEDPFLGLFDVDCNALAVNDDFGFSDSRLRFAVPSGGEFVLAATSCCDNTFVGTGGSAGTYELTVSEAPPPTCPAPTELALPASIDESLSEDDCRWEELLGRPNYSVFVDQYAVTLSAQGVLSISLDTATRGAYFQVWDAGYQEIVLEKYGWGFSTSDGAEFLAPGDYVVLVSHEEARFRTVPYSLSVSFEETNFDPDVALYAAVLPGSRSAQVGSGAYVTAFATIINAGSETGVACGISPAAEVPGEFFYRSNNGNKRIPLPANVPLDIQPFAESSDFVIGFLPGEPFDPTELEFEFACANAAPATVVSGLNTLLLSASLDPVADVMANAATLCNDGIVRLSPETGTGVFAVAATNLGAGDELSVSVDAGTASLPVSLSICQTDAFGLCINPVIPSSEAVRLALGTDEVATFGLFVTGSAPIAADAARSRLFVRFADSNGTLRGSTSVALQTREPFFSRCPLIP